MSEDNGTITKPSPMAKSPRVITEIEPRFEAGKLIRQYADGLVQLAGVHGTAATQWIAEAIDAADRFYLANRGKTVIPESIVRCIKNGAGLNLSFNHTLGQLYLVPFKNGEFTKRNNRDTYEAQLVVGYQGYEALAYGTGWLDTLYVECVTETELQQDRFEWWIDEAGPHIRHRPMLGRSLPRSSKDAQVEIALAYVSYRTKTGNVGCAVADKARIGRAVNLRSDMWKWDYPAGAKKTAIREAAKHWPKTRLMGGALYLDDMAEIDQSQSDITATRVEAEPAPRVASGPSPGEVAGLGEDDADQSPAFKALEYRIEGGGDDTYPALRAAVKEAVYHEQITETQGKSLRAAIDRYADEVPY